MKKPFKDWIGETILVDRGLPGRVTFGRLLGYDDTHILIRGVFIVADPNARLRDSLYNLLIGIEEVVSLKILGSLNNSAIRDYAINRGGISRACPYIFPERYLDWETYEKQLREGRRTPLTFDRIESNLIRKIQGT